MPACQPSSESQTRRTSALRSALGPVLPYLEDPRVVEVMLNADGVVWVDKLGEGMLRTPVTMLAPDAERMLRLVASEVLVELNAQAPSLSAKLPPPWRARLQAAIPPIVDAPVFALRNPWGPPRSLPPTSWKVSGRASSRAKAGRRPRTSASIPATPRRRKERTCRYEPSHSSWTRAPAVLRRARVRGPRQPLLRGHGGERERNRQVVARPVSRRSGRRD